MRMILTALLALPGIVQAQTLLDLPYLDRADTRFGSLTVAPVDLGGMEGRQFLLDGQPIDAPRDAYAFVQAVLPEPGGGDQDWVLVSVAGGGNACPTLWAFVTVSPQGATATLPFGTCAEEISDLHATRDETLVLDMVGMAEDGSLTRHSYSFDGVSVTETIAPLP